MRGLTRWPLICLPSYESYLTARTSYGANCCNRNGSRIGGCVPQEADLAAITAMVSKNVQKIVPPDMTGNCVLDFEAWSPVVDLGGQFGNTFARCPILGDEDSGTPGKSEPRPVPKHLIFGPTLVYNYR